MSPCTTRLLAPVPNPARAVDRDQAGVGERGERRVDLVVASLQLRQAQQRRA
jgi:hypothetical protein